MPLSTSSLHNVNGVSTREAEEEVPISCQPFTKRNINNQPTLQRVSAGSARTILSPSRRVSSSSDDQQIAAAQDRQDDEGGAGCAADDDRDGKCSPFYPSVIFTLEKGLTILLNGRTGTQRPPDRESIEMGEEASEEAATQIQQAPLGNGRADGQRRREKQRNNNEDDEDCIKWRLQDAHASTTLDLPAYSLGLLLVGIVWLLLWSAFSSEWMAPGSGSPVFDPIAAILFSTFTGKLVCKIFKLPALVGIIWFSILWGHIYETGYLVSGITPVVFFVIGRVGLTTILVRAGFALSWNVVRNVLFNAIALSLLPLILESVTHAIVARYIFFDEFDGGEWQWAFLQGFLCSVVSAAITVPGTIALQADGYQRGVPPLILSSVGLDTATGVWIVSFILSLVFDSGSGSQSLGLRVALGPIQLIGGVIMGVIIGIGFHVVVTRIAIRSLVSPLDLKVILKKATTTKGVSPQPHHIAPFAATEVLDRYVFSSFILIALAAVFFGNQVSLAGGGTILAITFGATVSHLWGYRVERQTEEIRRSLTNITNAPSSHHLHHALVLLPQEIEDNEQNTIGHNTSTNTAGNDNDNPATRQQPATTTTTVEEEELEGLLEKDSTVQLNRLLNALKARLGGNLATLWDVIVLGPLFTMSGAKVKLVDIFAADFFWKGLVVFICAAAVRITVSCSCGYGLGLSKKEIGFIGLGWLGKASVQAAMGSIALQFASSAYDAEFARISTINITTSADTSSLAGLARRVVAAETVQNTSILFILISAPLCAIFVSKLGPTMLTKGTFTQ